MFKTLQLFFFIIIGQILYAQTGEIRGFIYDKKTGEPMIYTTVRLFNSTESKALKGAVTNLDGYYSLNKIQAGKYRMMVTFLGYDSISYEFSIAGNEKLSKNLYLSSSVLELKEATITAEKQKKETRVEISKAVITPKELDKIPTIGGQADLAQYLQVLPGVVSSGDQGGQLYVRGGPPIQNKVLLDGMTIYNPFHSIGLFSVFDVDILKNVDVYTGGFPAEYGGRISAIMDVTTRDGSKERVGGKLSVGTIASKLMLEGPLKKFQEGKSNASFLLSARSSYLDRTGPKLYPYADSNGLPFSFNDFYGKITFNGAGGNKLSIFGFSFNDDVNFKNSTQFNWQNNGVGTKFILLPPSSSTVIDGNFSYSSYNTSQTERDGRPRYSQIGGFEAGINFSQYPNRDLIKYGVQLVGFQTDYKFTNVNNREIQQKDFTTELAAYFRYNKVIGRLVLDPSIRAHYYASLDEFRLEPRLGAKFVVNSNFRLKLAGGYFSQNLISAQSDRDVVNLFYGFISGPDDLQNSFNGQAVDSKLQKAIHAIGGFELDINKYMNIQIEAYVKDYTQLTNINRNKIFDNTTEFLNKPEIQRLDYIRETGRASGGDFKIVFDKGRLYLYGVYSLTFVDRFDGFEHYKPHWDRRHNVNIVASYEFGKKKSWQVNTRWNYGSGFPFTKTQGFYEQLDFQNGVSTNYTNTNGNLGILYGSQNGGRLSDYHRFDLSIQKSFFMQKGRKVSVNFSVSNVYDRKNVFYFDRIAYKRVNQLPILPSLTINYHF